MSGAKTEIAIGGNSIRPFNLVITVENESDLTALYTMFNNSVITDWMDERSGSGIGDKVFEALNDAINSDEYSAGFREDSFYDIDSLRNHICKRDGI